MKRGVYSIAEQNGRYGFFGEIELESELLETAGAVIVKLDSHHSSYWENSIKFGVHYFLEHYPNAKGLFVSVNKLKTNDVDTSFILLAFITIKALERAYDIENPIPIFFDRESNLFSFIK